MRSIILITLVLFLPFTIYSQVKATIVDVSSNQPIPYASVYLKNQEKGTNSDLNGKILIVVEPQDTLMISSVGYKSLELPFSELKDTIKIEQDVQRLKEVEVRPSKKRNWFAKNRVIGELKRKQVRASVLMSTSGSPMKIGRFFKYKNTYSSSPYIAAVRFESYSEINGAIYAVNFYTINSEGLPNQLINTKPIIGTVKKGAHKTSTIKIENPLIKFPKEGLFVSIDYILTDSNKSLKDENMTFYEERYKYDFFPAFYLDNSDHFDLFLFNYESGVWYKSTDFHNILKCEIVLSE